MNLVWANLLKQTPHVFIEMFGTRRAKPVNVKALFLYQDRIYLLTASFNAKGSMNQAMHVEILTEQEVESRIGRFKIDCMQANAHCMLVTYCPDIYIPQSERLIGGNDKYQPAVLVALKALAGKLTTNQDSRTASLLQTITVLVSETSNYIQQNRKRK